jgi:hypothetical protein
MCLESGFGDINFGADRFYLSTPLWFFQRRFAMRDGRKARRQAGKLAAFVASVADVVEGFLKLVLSHDITLR